MFQRRSRYISKSTRSIWKNSKFKEIMNHTKSWCMTSNRLPGHLLRTLIVCMVKQSLFLKVKISQIIEKHMSSKCWLISYSKKGIVRDLSSHWDQVMGSKVLWKGVNRGLKPILLMIFSTTNLSDKVKLKIF